MLAYAASRPQPVPRQPAPHAMLGIIALHVGLIAAVMSAKMDLPAKVARSPLVVDLIHEDDPPPARVIEPRVPSAPLPSQLDQPRPLVPVPSLDPPDSQPAVLPSFDQLIPALPGPGPSVDPIPNPAPLPVKLAAQLATPAAKLKPPYPVSKLASGEEAVLRLRLSIDERGRVVAVESLSAADRAFVDAARRHLIANWRYRPATEDGRAVATSAVITLRFQLEG
jgi:protein TonB